MVKALGRVKQEAIRRSKRRLWGLAAHGNSGLVPRCASFNAFLTLRALSKRDRGQQAPQAFDLVGRVNPRTSKNKNKLSSYLAESPLGGRVGGFLLQQRQQAAGDFVKNLAAAMDDANRAIEFAGI